MSGDKACGADDSGESVPESAKVVSGTTHGPTVQAGVVRGDIHVHGSGKAPPEDPPVPRQLQGVPILVDRLAELAAMESWQAEGGERCVLVALGGSGGVGKTTLGSWWLQRERGRFEHGQLCIDLGAEAVNPMSPREALGRLLRALGISPDRVPLGLSERMALYRSVTAERSLALLLDNAVSAAQVRPLLPNSARSVVVVTSRVRLVGLTLDGARFLDLIPLDGDHAIEMLSRLVGRERVMAEQESARALVRLCSGFPLALAIVGARLLAHPQWTMERLTEQLRDERHRLPMLSLVDDVSVQSVLDACYRELSPDASRLYRLLAVSPGEDFPLELAESVTDVEAESGLRELVEANLVREPSRGRFRYHDLLRVHARQVSAKDDGVDFGDRACRRAIDWYLDRSVEADVAVNPHRRHLGPRYVASVGSSFVSAEQALEWYEQERANLLEVLFAARDLGLNDRVWQLCESLWSFFLYRKHYQDWVDTHRIGIESAARSGHALAESRLRCQLGFAYLDQRRFDAVTDICVPALALAEATGDEESMSTASEQLGKAARERGHLREALRCFERSLALAESTGNLRGIALQSRFLGTVLADLGRYGEALDQVWRSVTLLAEIADERGRARALTFLGRISIRAGRPESAGGALHEALDIMRSSGSPTYQADVLCELATLAECRDEITVARRYLREAADLYRAADHPRSAELRSRLEDPESHG